MTRARAGTLCFLAIWIGSTVSPSPLAGESLSGTTADVPLALIHATLVDPPSPRFRENMTLLIRDSRIESVGPTADIAIPSNAQVIDLAGQYVVPGLIEGHVHLRNLPDRQLEYALCGGITALRSMADDGSYLARLVAAIEGGRLLGPDIYFSAVLGGPRLFLEDSRTRLATPDSYRLGEAPWLRRLDEGADIDAVVEAARACGATGLKLMNYLNGDQITRIVRAARREGLMVWSHPHLTYASAKEIAACDVDLITHAIGLILPRDWDIQKHGSLTYDLAQLESGRLDSILTIMRENEIALEPTFAVFFSILRMQASDSLRTVLTNACVEIVRRAHDRGVTIIAGTDVDLPQHPGDRPALIDEIQYLVELVGMHPAEALAAATRDGARVLGLDETLGSIAPGKLANLIVLGRDPLRDIKALAEPVLVIKHGTRVESSRCNAGG